MKFGLKNPRPTSYPRWSALRAKYRPERAVAVGPVDLLHYFPTDSGMLGNDQYGDCFWAANYHAHQVRSRVVTGTMDTQPVSIVLGAYGSATGFNESDPSTDNGTDAGQGFDWIEQNGLPMSSGVPVQMLAAIEVNPLNWAECLEAMDYCGGLLIGFTVPQSLVDNLNSGVVPSVWGWPVGNSLSSEGHEVYVCKGDPGSGTQKGLISWGSKYAMTHAFWVKSVNQCTAVITQDWIDATGKTPLDMTVEQLEAEMDAMSAGPIP